MNDLIVIEKASTLTVFSTVGGLTPMIERIEKEARAQAATLDISTKTGREAIASLAYKIARSKTTLDNMGKELTEDWKRQSKAVDDERKRTRERLEALQDEVRKPLTEWQEAEEKRVEGHEIALAAITVAASQVTARWQTMELAAMTQTLSGLQGGARDWQEFSGRATAARISAMAQVQAAIAQREGYDAEQAELARLRQEEQERQRKEAEARIAAEAAASAKAEAEAVAAEERRKLEEAQQAERVAAEAKAEAERQTAERERATLQQEKEAAEARARKTEQEAKAAAEKAESDRIAAEQKAKDDATAAAKAERDRIEAERQAEIAAAAKREANRAHQGKIHRDVIAALAVIGVGEDVAKAIITHICTGIVPHVKIIY